MIDQVLKTFIQLMNLHQHFSQQLRQRVRNYDSFLPFYQAHLLADSLRATKKNSFEDSVPQTKNIELQLKKYQLFSIQKKSEKEKLQLKQKLSQLNEQIKLTDEAIEQMHELQKVKEFNIRLVLNPERALKQIDDVLEAKVEGVSGSYLQAQKKRLIDNS